MKRKQEHELQPEAEQKRSNGNGDGVAWFRGELIGKGSFGSVYLATLKKPKSRYRYLPSVMAVKSAEFSVSGSLQKEREVLNNVKGCPNIIGCFGEETTNGENGEMVYNLLLEYGSGGTLAEMIRKSAGCGLPDFAVRRYTRSLLQGLDHIHGCGYVHCDLKPQNILLVPYTRGGTTEFKAKIGDFGLAKRAKKSKKRTLDPYWRGTPLYLSPETVVDNTQEPPSDIWALGCIVLEMLTGKPPWENSTTKDLLCQIGKRRGLPKVPSEISKEGRDFLKACFVRKVTNRLTAKMLLDRPFVRGLVDDNEVEEVEEVSDVNGIGSFVLLSETDDEFSYSSSPDERCFISGEESFSYWSEEDVEELGDEVVSSFAEGALGVQESRRPTNSTIDAGFDHAIKVPIQV